MIRQFLLGAKIPPKPYEYTPEFLVFPTEWLIGLSLYLCPTVSPTLTTIMQIPSFITQASLLFFFFIIIITWTRHNYYPFFPGIVKEVIPLWYKSSASLLLQYHLPSITPEQPKSQPKTPSKLQDEPFGNNNMQFSNFITSGI
jgi:hypothetical protein